MAMPQTKRWWFIFPLPSAILLAALISFLGILSSAEDEALYIYIATIPYAVVIGGASFPIGLPALFCRDSVFLQHHFDLIVCAGYITYIVLTVWGIIRPNRVIFIVLCLLLLANVAGCQLERAIMSIPRP